MMIGSSREEETSTKQELPRSHEKVQTGSRIWSSALKNPRIVRVGRSFGGKDRHSKVSTVRGLRDRRIRLSVPTAIQLYDLQDKLGLSQPSKVVDWLLNAAQHEIDKLPPLQMPPESLMQFPHQPRATSRRKAAAGEPSYFFHDNGSAQQLALSDTNLADGGGQSVLSKSLHWNPIATPGNKGKETVRESDADAEKSSCMIDKRSGSGNQEVGLVMNNAMPHGAYYQLEPPNSSLSHLSAAEVPHGHHLIMPKLQYSHFQMTQLASEGFHDQNPFRISQQSVDNPNFLVLQPNYVFRNHGAHNQGHNGS